LADPKKLLEDLFDFDKDNIPDRVINLIAPYMERPDFDPVAIKKASIACEALCMWTRAMYKYHFVAKGVEPKRIMLREAEADLAECQEKLEIAQSQLREVQAKIAKLEADFDAAVAKQDELQADMDLCLVKLERAHKLIGGLGGEKARWGQNVKDLSLKFDLLAGDCIIAAGMISYAGPFTAEVRTVCESEWCKKLVDLNIKHTPECSMKTVLGEPVKIQAWVVASLPNDALSIENGIIIDRSRRWPLMIDPQRQANKYIKNMGKETETGIDVIKLSEKNFLRTLELGIQFGKWILLENIGISLDPALEPILLQQKIKDGSGYTMRLGDKTITYNMTFKFFLTTTLPNPHYSPETSVKVTLLNFAITPGGLEDQMLGIVVAKERPDLEEQKNELVVANAKMNRDLKEIEDEILKLLAESSGDVLEDDVLVNKVTTSKQVSDAIAEKQALAAETEITIDTARESYRPVAYRTAVLFFCVVELAGIDPMYQYSLQWFQQLFGLCIDNAPKADELDERLLILMDFFTEGLYQNICRGLFERDKPLFSFALCVRILMGDHKVDNAELKYLLVGPTSDMVEKGPPIPADWVGKPRWNEILTMSQLPALKGFDTFFAKNIADFRKLYDVMQADLEPIPGDWEEKLSPMQKLCFIRAFRLDNLKDAVVTFISHYIGQKFVEPPTFDIAKSYADSVNTTPLVFILSPGTDPTADVIGLAETLGMSKRFDSISLGQGQGPKATKLIEQAQQVGGWVLLTNCHLMESWMSSLEAITEAFNPELMANNFRLWLTSMPSPTFPVPILQNGVKMTNEPPTGLRANLLRSYSQIQDKLFEEANKPETFKMLLFSFCFFHAIVQDRRKFGPIGWNIAYGFTPEDLQVCKSQLMTFTNQYEDVPYKVLNFLGAAINYGGRVTDDKDKLLINTILETFICKEVILQKTEYKFSSSGLYHAPDGETVAEMIEYIKGLPLAPMPEAFGLHENCNITVSQDQASNLLTGMQSMVSLAGDGAGGDSAEDVMDRTAASIQARLPKPFPLDICEEKFPTIYEESMNTVVKQECLRYNKLLWEMDANLKDFRKAIKGLIVMTADLEALGKSMFVNEQPDLWVKKGPLSLKPLSSWYLDILDRVAFFQLWYDLGKAPPVFWVSGIFFPQAFFTGAIQNYARKHNEEIDLLSNRQIMLDDIKDAKKELTAPPEEGVYVYGIFLEGARYSTSTHQIEDSRRKELYTSLPAMHFLPIKNRVPEILDYRCPCYKVVSRKGVLLTTGHSTNFVLYLEMKTDQPCSKWIKAGMAAFLALKY
jgi:dynein heavy chain